MTEPNESESKILASHRPEDHQKRHLVAESCPYCESPYTIVSVATYPGVAHRSCPLCDSNLGEV